MRVVILKDGAASATFSHPLVWGFAAKVDPVKTFFTGGSITHGANPNC